MSPPEVRPGQEWEKRHNDGPSSPPTRIRIVSITTATCSHVERPFGVRCERPALPRLVACEQHITPDAVRMVILAMDAEIERLKQLPDASPDNQ